MTSLRPSSGPWSAALACAADHFRAAYAGSPAQEYMASRGIDERTAALHRLGFVDPANETDAAFARFKGMLAIPNLNMVGKVVGIKFRSLDRNNKQRYDQPAGQEVHLFNLLSLRSHDGVTVGDTIAVVEGEIDAVSLTQLGIPAVAIPGAHNWRPYHRRVFDGFERIVFFYDRDVTREVNGKEINAGRELLKTLMASGLPIEPAEPPGGKDVNDALVAGFGDRLVEIFRGKRE